MVGVYERDMSVCLDVKNEVKKGVPFYIYIYIYVKTTLCYHVECLMRMTKRCSLLTDEWVAKNDHPWT